MVKDGLSMFSLRPKIFNLDQLKKSINLSSLLTFIIVFGFSLSALFYVHTTYIKSRELLNEDNIQLSINTYKSNLSEKLAIIASSTIFLDFLHSGETTRKKLLPEFTTLFYSLRVASVSGMKISHNDGTAIFSYGKAMPSYLTLNICYLNHSLNPNIGDCDFIWTLYFRKDILLSDIAATNNSIFSCKNCKTYPFNNSKILGSFVVKETNNLNMPLQLNDKNDTMFYYYFLLMVISLVFLAVWSWARLNSLLNNYIAVPVKKLTSSLKLDGTLDRSNNLDEIQFLINEIDSWREKLNKTKTLEHNAHLGKIAAQLAHDIRSPLSVIGMTLKKASNIPESHLKLVTGATQRIGDIADNFLEQYRNKGSDLTTISLNPEFISTITESIFIEKKAQFFDELVSFNLDISLESQKVLCLINSIEFKRLISNLVNNAVEALPASGFVFLRLITENDYAILTIQDNGIGIPKHLLQKILDDGISVGKTHGSGLGLSHAKRMIESWGGILKLSSVEGEGTVIKLMLPILT
jgi:signal transduction histidine kinase